MDRRTRLLERSAASSPDRTTHLRLASNRFRSGHRFEALEMKLQVALFAEHLTAGSLTEEDLALLCWTGDPRARRLRPDVPVALASATLDDLGELIAGLDRTPGAARMVLVSMACGAARGLAWASLVDGGMPGGESLPWHLASTLYRWASDEASVVDCRVARAYARLEAAHARLEREGHLDLWTGREHGLYLFVRGLKGYVGASGAQMAEELVLSGRWPFFDLARFEAELREDLFAFAWRRPRRRAGGPSFPSEARRRPSDLPFGD